MSAKPAGYSGTPLVRKLGIKPGMRCAFLGAPEGFDETLGPVPDGAGVRDALAGPGELAFVLFFTKERAALEARLPELKDAIDVDGMIWVGWPKKASKVRTDVTEDVVRGLALAGGLVDVKVCAIDKVWSGLKLMFRKADRPAIREARARRS